MWFEVTSSKTLCALIALSFSCAGCGRHKDSNHAPTKPKHGPFAVAQDPNKHVVLVLDSGFDIEDGVFQGKVLATYTLKCEKPSGSEGDSVGDLVAQKAAMLKTLRAADKSCRIEENLAFERSAAFQEILPEREKWNDGLRSKNIFKHYRHPFLGGGDGEKVKRILEILSGEGGTFTYHGTGTAGLVAYKNDNVQFVLVQKELASSESAAAGFKCISASELSREIELLSDPEVQEAFIKRPASSERLGLNELIRKHKVNLVNLSLGHLSREGLEKLSKEKACEPVDFKPYFRVLNELEAKAAQRLAETEGPPAYLTLQAAGNDGAQIDGAEDTLDCSNHDQNLLMVGAVDAAGLPTEWSNRGKCVDINVMGDMLVVSAPSNFLNLSSGTSFSTPLLAWYITQHYSNSDDPKYIMSDVLSKLDTAKALPWDATPIELAWAFSDEQLPPVFALQGDLAGPVRSLRSNSVPVDSSFIEPFHFIGR